MHSQETKQFVPTASGGTAFSTNKVATDVRGTLAKTPVEKLAEPRSEPFNEELEILRLQRKLSLCRKLLQQASGLPERFEGYWEANEPFAAGCNAPAGFVMTGVPSQKPSFANRVVSLAIKAAAGVQSQKSSSSDRPVAG